MDGGGRAGEGLGYQKIPISNNLLNIDNDALEIGGLTSLSIDQFIQQISI